MQTRATSITLTLALAAAACSTAELPRGTTGTTGPDAVPGRPAPASPRITGTATYLARIRTPPGSMLEVALVPTGDARGTALASTVVTDVDGPPVAFSLDYDPGDIRAGRAYGLTAALYDADGVLWFRTPRPVPVTPGGTAPVELRMSPVDTSSAEASRGKAVAEGNWACGDGVVTARFLGDPDRVLLVESGARRVLPIARSASGARYADRDGNEFWTKGDSGTLTLDGAKRDCTATTQASPWNEAALRGAAFRAVGGEPGWYVEVDGGTPPNLHAVLDYAERELSIPTRRSGDTFAGTTAAGQPVRLVATRTPCTDGMSGQRFPASARLMVAGKTYSGCGMFFEPSSADAARQAPGSRPGG